MGFLDSYKRLEKLCGDLLADDRRVSAYIDEMVALPSGARLVRGWDLDLKQLKHLRWVRNKIVHEPNCTEENLCAPGDVQWLNHFYDRILNQTDPLALYYKAVQAHTAARPKQPPRATSRPVHPSRRTAKRRPLGAALLVVGALLLGIAVFFLSK